MARLSSKTFSKTNKIFSTITPQQQDVDGDGDLDWTKKHALDDFKLRRYYRLDLPHGIGYNQDEGIFAFASSFGAENKLVVVKDFKQKAKVINYFTSAMAVSPTKIYVGNDNNNGNVYSYNHDLSDEQIEFNIEGSVAHISVVTIEGKECILYAKSDQGFGIAYKDEGGSWVVSYNQIYNSAVPATLCRMRGMHYEDGKIYAIEQEKTTGMFVIYSSATPLDAASYTEQEAHFHYSSGAYSEGTSATLSQCYDIKKIDTDQFVVSMGHGGQTVGFAKIFKNGSDQWEVETLMLSTDPDSFEDGEETYKGRNFKFVVVENHIVFADQHNHCIRGFDMTDKETYVLFGTPEESGTDTFWV